VLRHRQQAARQRQNHARAARRFEQIQRQVRANQIQNPQGQQHQEDVPPVAGAQFAAAFERRPLTVALYSHNDVGECQFHHGHEPRNNQ